MENDIIKKQKILIIGGSLTVGGVQKFVIEMLQHMNHTKWRVDYLSYSPGGNPAYIEIIEKFGGKVYYAPKKKDGFVKSLKAVHRIVEEERYDIVWKHTESLFRALDLWAAKKAGASRLILHSHRTETPKIERVIGFFLSPLMNHIVTDRFACGKNAGDHLHGKHKYTIVPNALDVQKYVFCNEIRDNIRESIGIDGDVKIIGHVGRLSRSKNHLFILQIFRSLLQIRKDVFLLLVGDGPLRLEIENEIELMNLQKHVYLAGTQSNVNEWLMGMDLFLFPSLYEGMPIGLLEAQFSGLPCLMSNVIDETIVVSNLVESESLANSPKMWAEIVNQMIEENQDCVRKTDLVMAKKSGYDVVENTRIIERILSDKRK